MSSRRCARARASDDAEKKARIKVEQCRGFQSSRNMLKAVAEHFMKQTVAALTLDPNEMQKRHYARAPTVVSLFHRQRVHKAAYNNRAESK
eukprot:6183137-Pleurochrysis_carterae.AAC.2